jgi:hypothetical protein
MTDDADRAQATAEQLEALQKRAPYVLAAGVPGDCQTCGEWSGRLVEGMCAPCRDRLLRVNVGNGGW